MSDHSAIEWTDATWNPVDGCSRISPGCVNCYAKAIHDRRHRAFLAGKNVLPLYAKPFEDVRPRPDRLELPLQWRRGRRIFVNSMSDLFHEDVPDTFLMNVFAIMEKCPQHRFQVLTKRAERMHAVMRWLGRKWAETGDPWPLPNVWLGVSVENQHFADERIQLLLQTPAAVRFISAEPLLESIDLWGARYRYPAGHFAGAVGNWGKPPRLDWVIVGGESGTKARPFDVAWARSIIAQCAAGGVPCFVKQFGANVRDRNDAGFEGDTPRSWPMDTDVRDYPDGYREDYQGAPVRVMLSKKGGDPSEWPKDLRVREFPAEGPKP